MPRTTRRPPVPPVPTENKWPKGTGSEPAPAHSDLAEAPDRPDNPDEPDRVANRRRNAIVEGSAGRRQRSGAGWSKGV